jgi:hypothetical protein
MTLRDLLDLDAKNVILNKEDLAEEVTYTPKVGSPVTINVLPERDNPDSREEGSGHRYRTARLLIQNSATSGVVTPKEGDTLSWAIRAGQPAKTCRVVAIIDSTPTYHRLEVSTS